ncbi:unnamed protein product [Meloidogyne enterolobii]|uniref:Uncharacterized protein n=2 Tax=Meloidogyne enterolobii TaxID=390850 RepID=A0ACB0ZTG4_MELEN
MAKRTALEANLSPLATQSSSNIEIDSLNSLINGQINVVRKSLDTITDFMPIITTEQMPILQSLIATLSDQFETLTTSLKNGLSGGSRMRVEGQLPEIEYAMEFCFYTSLVDEKTNKEVRSAVICIHPFYFTTYAHSSRLKYKENVTKIKVCKGNKEFNTTAVFVSHEQDFVVLKSETKICDFGPQICEKMCSGSIYLCGGFTNEIDKLKPCRKNGCLQSSKTERIKSLIFYLKLILKYSGGGELRGPYLIGVVTVSKGDSGCAVFCTHGLKGMSIGGLDFPDCSSKAIFENCAKFLPKCMIVPAIDIMSKVDVCYFLI